MTKRVYLPAHSGRDVEGLLQKLMASGGLINHGNKMDGRFVVLHPATVYEVELATSHQLPDLHSRCHFGLVSKGVGAWLEMLGWTSRASWDIQYCPRGGLRGNYLACELVASRARAQSAYLCLQLGGLLVPPSREEGHLGSVECPGGVVQ